MVKGRLKSELGIVRDALEAIPARRTECTGRVHEALKELRRRLVRGRLKRRIVHHIRIGIIEARIHPEAGTHAVDTLKIRFHIRLPLAHWPGGPRFLETRSGIYRKGGGAVRLRGIQIIAKGVGCDTHIIGLVKVVEFATGEGLLFY